MFDTNKSRLLLHLIFTALVIIDCSIYIATVLNSRQSGSDSSVLAALIIPQIIFAIIFNLYMEKCNPSDYEDHLFRNIVVGFFPFFAIIYVLLNLLNYISDYKQNSFTENLDNMKIGRHSAKMLINEFENYFKEFNLAEARSLIENGSNLDSEYIAQQSLTRIRGMFIGKFRLTPEQFEKVANLYVKHLSLK